MSESRKNERKNETMQEQWERVHEHLHLDLATLAAALAPVSRQPIRAAEPLGGGLANTNYKVTLAGEAEPLVVRIYTRDPTACGREVALHRLIQERIPVAEVVYADPGGERIGRPYLVSRWVEGVKLDALLATGDEDAIGAAARATGETLALLGAYTFPRAGFFGPGPDLAVADPLEGEGALAYIETLLDGLAGERLGEPLAQALRRLVRDHAALLRASDGVATLTHGDYKAQNLLARRVKTATPGDQRWTIAAVLDWEFACATGQLFDLAILLRYAERLPQAFERGVIAGFRAGGGALPERWKRVVKLLDLVNVLTFLARPSAGQHMRDDVIGLARATVERWRDF